MSVLAFFVINCFFVAFLLHFTVGWGDEGAKGARNTFIGIGTVLLLISIVHTIATRSGDAGKVLLVGALPLTVIGLSLRAFANLSSDEESFSIASKGGITLVVIALALAIIGLAIILIE